MSFDYSVTKLKRVKCSNSNCNHVFRINDGREPVVLTLTDFKG